MLLLVSPLFGEIDLSESQTEVLLERYREGVEAGKFVYRPGMDREDLEAYLRSGRISQIRRDVIFAAEQTLPEPESISVPSSESNEQLFEKTEAAWTQEPGAVDAWGESGFINEMESHGESWGQSSGWGSSDEKSDSAEVVSLLSGILEASESCNYIEAKRLADLVLDSDPTQSWVIENYPEIERWAEKSQVYYEALTAAYEALENENFDAMATHLRVALGNAASNCGQDVVAQSLLTQAAEASQNDRLAAIAQAKMEGSIHQRTFAQEQIAREAELAAREESKSGMKRGLMGLLSTAVKVGTLKKTGNLSSEDALSQVLQQQVAQSNPELAQLVSQAQMLEGGGDAETILAALQPKLGQSNSDFVQLLAQAQQLSGSSNTGNGSDLLQTLQSQGLQSNPQLAEMLAQAQLQAQSNGAGSPQGSYNGFGQAGGVAGSQARTQVSTASAENMSPICQQLYKELTRVGEQMKPYAEMIMSYQNNGNVSVSQLQSVSAEIQKLELQSRALVKKIKENNCPGSEDIPDYPY